jgi:hypothetical protein
MKLRVFTAIGIGIAAMVVASSGSAKWTIGNGTTDLEVNGPNPAQPGQVCTTHIEGRAGLSTTVDPAVTAPPPVPPNSTQVVELFTGPPGSLDGYRGGGTGELVPFDNSLPTVSAVRSVTTGVLTALNPPEYYTGNGNEDLWEYAAAPFSFDLPAGVIADGNQVALRVGSHEAILTLSAVACASTQPLTATIDVLPGISANLVIPSLKLPVLPVRVFGSASLDVTAIASVKLGNAAPATLPAALARLLAPRDRNGDGYLDRDYVFVPAATGIVCGATSASLTGTLAKGTAFTGTDRIRTILC